MQRTGEQTETAAHDLKPETKRGRVRRLFVTPMNQLGMKRPAKVDPETFAKRLDALTDYLTYMSDDGLSRLYEFMRYKGQGRNRDEWPARATVLAYAEMVENCPLERIPGMLSWFRSVAGSEAEKSDTLVETFEYLRDHKKPPTAATARALIARDAQERRREMELAHDRIARNVARPGDVERVAAYAALLEQVKSLMVQDPQGAVA